MRVLVQETSEHGTSWGVEQGKQLFTPHVLSRKTAAVAVPRSRVWSSGRRAPHPLPERLSGRPRGPCAGVRARELMGPTSASQEPVPRSRKSSGRDEEARSAASGPRPAAEPAGTRPACGDPPCPPSAPPGRAPPRGQGRNCPAGPRPTARALQTQRTFTSDVPNARAHACSQRGRRRLSAASGARSVRAVAVRARAPVHERLT